VIWLTEAPIRPFYTPGMTGNSQKPVPRLTASVAVDYALIATSVAAGLIALIYLILT
jgi:hypothetical protein